MRTDPTTTYMTGKQKVNSHLIKRHSNGRRDNSVVTKQRNRSSNHRASRLRNRASYHRASRLRNRASYHRASHLRNRASYHRASRLRNRASYHRASYLRNRASYHRASRLRNRASYHRVCRLRNRASYHRAKTDPLSTESVISDTDHLTTESVISETNPLTTETDPLSTESVISETDHLTTEPVTSETGHLTTKYVPIETDRLTTEPVTSETDYITTGSVIPETTVLNFTTLVSWTSYSHENSNSFVTPSDSTGNAEAASVTDTSVTRTTENIPQNFATEDTTKRDFELSISTQEQSLAQTDSSTLASYTHTNSAHEPTVFSITFTTQPSVWSSSRLAGFALCKCACPNTTLITNFDRNNFTEFIEELGKFSHNASSATRRKESADDPRTSSVCMGLIATVLMTAVFTLLIGSDSYYLFILFGSRN
ncbi:hypothetical protein ElyMa_005045700 [Elysia marginata]|uniref:Uncharacterized protein n=1 Tax=Elysia marginata TaxID=1093978 RepID=A0AAV4JG53_9GAST|nr:hypothetical protein ElyMa_005045700 [Elysia marginata]